MLKSKKALYVLVPIVCFIWGTVIYKIVTGLNPELPTVLDTTYGVYNPKLESKASLIPIVLPVQDPFLDEASSKRPDTTFIEPSDLYDNTLDYDTSAVYEPQEALPVIVYKGYVKNGSGKNRAVATTVDGISMIFKVGQTKNDLTLQIATDQVLKFRYNGTTLTIKKQ